MLYCYDRDQFWFRLQQCREEPVPVPIARWLGRAFLFHRDRCRTGWPRHGRLTGSRPQVFGPERNERHGGQASFYRQPLL